VLLYKEQDKNPLLIHLSIQTKIISLLTAQISQTLLWYQFVHYFA